MPNYIVSRVTAPEEVLNALVDPETGNIDFNLIVPQPANIEQGNCSGKHDEGVICWYRWNIDNWGVKWNCGEFVRESHTAMLMETAWSAPHRVFEALSLRFPEVSIVIEYADEDYWGTNHGAYVLEDGAVTENLVDIHALSDKKRVQFAETLHATFANGGLATVGGL